MPYVAHNLGSITADYKPFHTLRNERASLSCDYAGAVADAPFW